MKCAIAAFGDAVNCKIIKGEELKEQGFGGIYGVGKAAVEPPALCILSYAPQGAARRVCWVGKGIVYDTGGLSIKSSVAQSLRTRACGRAVTPCAALQRMGCAA